MALRCTRCQCFGSNSKQHGAASSLLGHHARKAAVQCDASCEMQVAAAYVTRIQTWLETLSHPDVSVATCVRKGLLSILQQTAQIAHPGSCPPTLPAFSRASARSHVVLKPPLPAVLKHACNKGSTPSIISLASPFSFSLFAQSSSAFTGLRQSLGAMELVDFLREELGSFSAPAKVLGQQQSVISQIWL